MEDPASEIRQVILTVTSAINPDIQKAAIEKYFAPNAELHHPLCVVLAGAHSRDDILGVYQWYRVLSPNLTLEIRGVTHNPSSNELFVEVVQNFHIRWSPLPSAPARLIVHLILQPSDINPKLQVIKYQEDFFHPEDVASLIVPPFATIIRLMLRLGGVASNWNARLFGSLGYWSAKEDEGLANTCVSAQATPLANGVAAEPLNAESSEEADGPSIGYTSL